jgi:hypothetical protein
MPFSWVTNEFPTATKMNQMAIAGPCARVFHSANQSTTSGVFLSVAFDSERFDTDTIHDTVTNNTRLTCKTAGKYLITASIEIAFNATGTRIATLRLNGVTPLASMSVPAAATGSVPTRLTPTTIYDLAVNDYVEVQAWQDSGGALNVSAAGNYSPEFMMVRVA